MHFQTVDIQIQQSLALAFAFACISLLTGPPSHLPPLSPVSSCIYKKPPLSLPFSKNKSIPISLNLSKALTKHYSPPMASPSKSIRIAPCMRSTISLILVLFLLLIGSCTATRPGVTITVNPKPLRGKDEMGFRYHGQIFSFFPKGTPVPPSGPSKRHNSVVDSTQN